MYTMPQGSAALILELTTWPTGSARHDMNRAITSAPILRASVRWRQVTVFRSRYYFALP